MSLDNADYTGIDFIGPNQLVGQLVVLGQVQTEVELYRKPATGGPPTRR